MVSCYYKKLSIVLIISILLQVFNPAIIFAARTLWPSEMNLFNDAINLDHFIATTTVARDTKKGFLFTSDPREVFTLGAGHIAINMTLSGKGHAFYQYIDGLKKRGVKITMIIINDKPPVGTDTSKAPAEFRNPYFYMIDFFANNGEWQQYNFNRIVEEYSAVVDDWVIGNEINSQLYNYYGPSDIKSYVNKYCENFYIMYKKIKEYNKDASVYISFDQGWDLPAYDMKSRYYDEIVGKYRYNSKEVLAYINEYLPKDCDWGVSLHPYPTPLEEGMFWDDEYAGFDIKSKEEKERPYLLTLKNFEVALEYLSEKRFLKKDKNIRDIIISEVAITSKNGERIQAAGLYYLWKKIRDNNLIRYFLYNAQTDLPDGYNFGLTSDKKKKRLAWAVFKDMDKSDECVWCKDLLDNVLSENGYVDVNGIIFNKASLSELPRK